MIRDVPQLAIDGLQDGMSLAADGDGAGEIGIGERLDGGEEAAPAVFPQVKQLGARRGRVDELAVAVAIRLFAVGGEEVGPARAHVARHVLHDDGDGIGFGVEGHIKLLIRDLRHRTLRQALGETEEGECVFKKRCCEFECHGESPRQNRCDDSKPNREPESDPAHGSSL